MRICSLLPSATEILFALGLGDQVVGVSHECEYPPQARRKPRVIHSRLNQDHASSHAIDLAVRDSLAQHRSLYDLDLERLRELQPDVIITQELCDVCAITTSDVQQALHRLNPAPAILSLHPHTLRDLFSDIERIGRATQAASQARHLIRQLIARLEHVDRLVAGTTPPRVVCIEWLEPLMSCGHWVPEQVMRAGGQEMLGRAGQRSRVIDWPEVVEARPDVMLVMPCGFSIERTRKELPLLTDRPGWRTLPAAQRQRVYLVDGPAYFNCSGPRLVDGVELLAGLLHPDHADQFRVPGFAFRVGNSKPGTRNRPLKPRYIS